MKRSPPSRAFEGDRENVDHRQQAKGLRGKGLSNTTEKKATTKQLTSHDSLPPTIVFFLNTL